MRSPPAVDAGDLVALLANHEPASVVLCLEAMAGAIEQTVEFRFLSGIEELAADAAVGAVVVGGAVGLAGLTDRAVAFGDLLANEE